MKKLIYIIGMLIILQTSLVLGYTLDGDGVYINNTDSYIKFSPHTLTKSSYVYGTLTSKTYDGNANLIFGLSVGGHSPMDIEYLNRYNQTVEYSLFCDTTIENRTLENHTTYAECTQVVNATNFLQWNVTFDRYNLSTDTIYWNHVTEHEVWTSFNKTFTSVAGTLNGKDTWYYVNNINLDIGQTYEYRFWIDITPGIYAKYDFAYYPSSYGTDFVAADTAGNFHVLDPFINATIYQSNLLTDRLTGTAWPNAADNVSTTFSTRPMAYYTFDTNDRDATKLISAANVYSATIKGNAAPSTGKVGDSAFTFDGTGDFMNTTIKYTHTTNGMAICGWINQDLQEQAAWTGTGATSNSDWLNRRLTTGGCPGLATSIRGNGGIPSIGTLCSPVNLTILNWEHTCSVYYNPNNITIFENGVKTASVNINLQNDFSPGETFPIGARNDKGTFDTFWEGDLDDMIFFNKSITASQVFDIYNQSLIDRNVMLTTGTYLSKTFESGDTHSFAIVTFTNKGNIQVDITIEGDLFTNITNGTQLNFTQAVDGNATFDYFVTLFGRDTEFNSIQVTFGGSALPAVAPTGAFTYDEGDLAPSLLDIFVKIIIGLGSLAALIGIFISVKLISRRLQVNTRP